MLGQVMFAQKLRHCQHTRQSYFSASLAKSLAWIITAPTDDHDLKSRSANERMELGSCFIKTKYKRMKCDSNTTTTLMCAHGQERSQSLGETQRREILKFDSILKLRRKSRLAVGFVMIYHHSLKRVNSHLSRYLHRL